MNQEIPLNSRAPNAAEQQLKQQVLELWEQDRARLILKQPFLALLAMRLELVPVVDSRLNTACTDGRSIFFNAHFVQQLSAAQRVFVLGHEVWHCAARHFIRRGSRDSERWNIACDHEVNALLKEEGLSLPDDCVYFRRHHGDNAESVYASAACDSLAKQGEHGAARSEKGRRGRLADQHEFNPDEAATQTANRAHDIVVDPDLGAFQRQGEWQDWPARVVAVAQQLERQRGRGYVPQNIRQLVNGYRKPTVPWREVLSRFATQTLGGERHWLPPQRRHIYQGLYLPSRREKQLAITVAVDTSGSTRADLPRFLGELVGLLTSFGRYELRLLMCDARVHSDIRYDDSNPLDPHSLSFDGGGGTSFTPVFDYLAKEQEQPAALIFFTDGCGDAPLNAPDYPVLWAICAQGRMPCDWGEMIQLSAA